MNEIFNFLKTEYTKLFNVNLGFFNMTLGDYFLSLVVVSILISIVVRYIKRG